MADGGNQPRIAGYELLGSPRQNLLRALAFVGTVYVFATAGFVAAGWPPGDAFYMVTLTIFSVGYGEVHPIDTPWLRALAIATIVLGCTGMIVLTGALVQVFAHYQFSRLLGIDRMQNQLERLSGHTIVCGLGRIGRQLTRELAAAGTPFVVIEREGDKLAEAREHGYLCLLADATDEDALRAAGIDRARVLATVLPNDAANVFITLSARNLNPRLEIIARGEVPSTESKLLHAGADKVVMPTHIGAERIAELILYPTTSRFTGNSDKTAQMKRTLHEFGLELEAVEVPKDGEMVGVTVEEAERRCGGSCFVIQLDRLNGPSLVHPPADERIAADDTVVLVLRGGRVAAGTLFAAHRKRARDRTWLYGARG